MNNLALSIAWEAHKNQTRKGTDIPYIVHPIEVAMILIDNGANDELISAGLLHDTLEDTDIRLSEIREKFGENVARLVLGASEPDKIELDEKLTNEQEKKSWKKRKKHTIKYLVQAPKDVKLVTCADKLSNIRCMMRDYKEIGNEFWNRFNGCCGDQKWYYVSIVKSLKGISEYNMYKELEATVNELFNSKKVMDYINSCKKTQ